MEITTKDDPIAAKVLEIIKDNQNEEVFTTKDKALIFIRNFFVGLGLLFISFYIYSHLSNQYYAIAFMLIVAILYGLFETLLYWIAYASIAGGELEEERNSNR